MTTTPELGNLREFEMTASFTGQLGSLGLYRFKPMVRVEKGVRYRVSIDPATGVTKFTPIQPDPLAEIKQVSHELSDQAKRKLAHE